MRACAVCLLAWAQAGPAEARAPEQVQVAKHLEEHDDDFAMERVAKRMLGRLTPEEMKDLCFAINNSFKDGLYTLSMCSGSELQWRPTCTLQVRATFIIYRTRSMCDICPSVYACCACDMFTHGTCGCRCQGDLLFDVLGNSGKYLLSAGCEKEAWERLFAKHIILPTHMECACSFEDIVEMGNKTAKCSEHGKQCEVPNRVRIAIAGWSCEDLSRLKKLKGAERSKLGEGDGASTKTLRGLLDNITNHPVPVYIGGNLDEIAKAGGDNHIYVVEARLFVMCMMHM